MDESDRPSAPVFKRCVRCGYLLRGLPANHACPECGLRFDERCEMYRVSNPKRVLVWWVLIAGGGWVSVQNIAHLIHFPLGSTWGKLVALAVTGGLLFAGIGAWALIKRYRRGFAVALTVDGLLIRLPGFKDEVVPWTSIGRAVVKQRPVGKPQVATVYFKDRQKFVDIGGMQNVFPRRPDVERFVEQVNARVQMASVKNDALDASNGDDL